MVLLILGGVAFLGGAVVVIDRFTRRDPNDSRLRAPRVRRLSRSQDAPRVDIDAAGDDRVRIEGVVEALQGTRTGPMSEVACVWYEHVVESNDTPLSALGLPALGWRPIHRAIHAAPFVVRDASGYAIVDPEGAAVLVAVHRSEPYQPTGASQLSGFGPLTSSRQRWRQRERIIRPGDRIAVVGRAVREPDPDATRATGTYRDGGASRLRFTHSPQSPLHLLDAAGKRKGDGR